MPTLPRFAPMLATPGRLPSPAVDDRWAYEVKQDGQRAVIYLPGDGTVELRARSGTDITAAYPDLAGLGDALGGVPAVLDGEIVALDSQGRSNFERLQSRMGLSGSPAKAARAARRVPAHLVLFDALFLRGTPSWRGPTGNAVPRWRGSGWPGHAGRRPRWSSARANGPWT